MASRALVEWDGAARDAIDELRNAHRQVGGTGPGRRRLTQQINYAYVTLLAARFQGFARALHSQTAAVLAQGVTDATLAILFQESLTRNRKVDRGNATVGNVADDFARFGFDLWQAVDAAHPWNADRRQQFARLMKWRNAIVHDEIDRRLPTLEPKRINLDVCRDWHRKLDNLAKSMDRVLADQCEAVGRPRPW